MERGSGGMDLGIWGGQLLVGKRCLGESIRWPDAWLAGSG